MVKTASTFKLAVGSPAPDFQLPDPNGTVYTLASFADAKALVVAFLCNHCPFVKHIRHGFAALAKEYRDHGVAVVAINSNDITTHPDDSPEKMAQEIQEVGYIFPYLFDEDQSVAKAYGAACTPDFFVFDANRNLFYSGQMDDSRPGSEIEVNGQDLRLALDAVLKDTELNFTPKPSIGCNIKWKAGNEPDYFNAQGVA